MLRAYMNVFDRVAGLLGPDQALADAADAALAELWSAAKPATWNRDRAAVGSWLAWCAARCSSPPTAPARAAGRPPTRVTCARARLGYDRARILLGYDRARILLGQYGDGLRLQQLRHSSATHLGDANTSANVIMAKAGHKSLRSVQRYVKPGLAAVHQATEVLSSPRRRG